MPKIIDLNQQPNLPQLEEKVLKWWQNTKAFEKSVEMRPADKAYIFYDGPPFATGMPHYGHLLASTTKDVIPRYWTMKGYRVGRVWGWDCHGLPIENMIEQKLEIEGGKRGIEKLGIGKFNDACQREVLRLDKEWEKIIIRLGRWVDFTHNYKTMDCNFMESVWWGFKQLYEKNLVYEGKRVILYCPRCSTPLSNFEIAMDDSYEEITELSTTYKFKVKEQENTYLLAWSTTPWNKLVTTALAVHPTLEYSKVKQDDAYYILTTNRLNETLSNKPYEVVATMTGEELTQLEYELLFDFYPNRKKEERAGVVVADDFVTDEEGTGIVTLAIYGEDDYRVMQRENVQLVEHVNDEGKFKSEVLPWAGMDILEANPLINRDLKKRGLIYKDEQLTHSVATCYRCGTRLYYAPVPAWFIDITKLKDSLIEQNEVINWYPNHLKHGRFEKGLENAPDWNISRSRYWGTPMPIWRGKKDNQIFTRIIGSLAELKQWAVNPDEVSKISDIHRQYLDHIKVWVDDSKTIQGTRLTEVFDCWIESGSMPFASIHYPFENKQKFETNYPAQFVSEYLAQTRAWFYTMHVMSVGIFGKPSFENVLTTGTILAEDGSKMSKSKKNFPDPTLLIDKYGVDSLRLYLMSSTIMKGENLNFSEKEVADIRRKVFVIWWNVFKFFKTFANQLIDVAQTPTKPKHVMDKWLLSRVQHLIFDVTRYMDSYDLIRSSRTLMEFVDELSTWYLRLSRERLREKDNQGASHVFGYALYTLAQLMAPLTPYFPELIHHNLIDESTSIHHTDWPKVDTALMDPVLEAEMTLVQEVVNQARCLRKNQEIKLRQPLAKLIVIAPGETPQENLLQVIAQELNVKKIDWQSGEKLEVNLDFDLTNELLAEGEAREVMREIQKLRKKTGLKLDQRAKVEAPSWPKDWQSEIEKRTNTQLVKGDKLGIIAS
ncbi:isoleucine--tRNA ligase [Patescibacteria group bacterium]|nr:isoleucine--tRNA ligase [Patescibacteria group bacterium]